MRAATCYKEVNTSLYGTYTRVKEMKFYNIGEYTLVQTCMISKILLT